MRVPWRPDRRPLEGALQGAYAYLALTHWYRELGAAARESYHRYQSWVCKVASELLATGALTADGERFVSLMHAAAEGAAAGDPVAQARAPLPQTHEDRRPGG